MEVFKKMLQMLGFFEIFGHMILKCYISKFEYFEHGVSFSQLGKCIPNIIMFGGFNNLLFYLNISQGPCNLPQDLPSYI
jgi:hypothetical protein